MLGLEFLARGQETFGESAASVAMEIPGYWKCHNCGRSTKDKSRCAWSQETSCGLGNQRWELVKLSHLDCPVTDSLMGSRLEIRISHSPKLSYTVAGRDVSNCLDFYILPLLD